MFEPVPPYRPACYRVKFAAAPWERAACATLRRRVFCVAQSLFPGDDRDALDARAIPICAVTVLHGDLDAVAGTVRIHDVPERPGKWWGSRLAVEPAFRRSAALGSGLVRVAVSSARTRGCTRFLAHVQAGNVALFEALA